MLIGDGQKITSEGSTLGIGGSLTTDTSITSGTYISSGTTITATTSITAGTSFKIGSVDLNQTDLEKIDSITNGIASANKALVVDSNKDINGIRNLNIDGNLTIAGTTTTINSTTVEVSDGLFKYAKDNNSDITDFGWYGQYKFNFLLDRHKIKEKQQSLIRSTGIRQVNIFSDASKNFFDRKHTKMKINRFDDFTKLREIVLGDVNYSPLSLIKDQNDRDFMRHVLDETKSSLTNLEQIFKK